MILTSHLLLMVLTAGTLAPCFPAQDAEAQEPLSWSTQVIGLSHADASDVAAALDGLATQTRVVVVSASNELILRGLSQHVDELAALAAKLDKPGGASSALRQEVVKLQYASARDVQSVLQSTVQVQRSGPHLRIASDARNNAVVLSGPDQEILRALQLVKGLDVAAPQPKAAEPSSLKLTFYFLAASFTGESVPGGAPLPAALKPVAAAMAESGFTGLTLVSPASVMADPSAGFRQAWPVGIDEKTTLNFDVSGEAQERGDGEAVRLAVNTAVRGTRKEGAGTANFTAFSLETEVTTPLNEYVVLAANPSGANLGGAMILVIRVTREAR